MNPSVWWQNSIIQNLEKLYEENKDDLHPFMILERTAVIFRILAENMDAFSDCENHLEDIGMLTAMMGYVQKNYASKILLKDIAATGNCCKTKCTALFGKYLNTSPMVYLNQYRLDKAVSLLLNTEKSITEIAYACGFSNSSYFCELFRKYYHITPGNFRKNDR